MSALSSRVFLRLIGLLGLAVIVPLAVSFLLSSRVAPHHGVSVVGNDGSTKEPTFEAALARLNEGKAGGYKIKSYVWVRAGERNHLISRYRLRGISINGQKRGDVFSRPWTIDKQPLPSGLVPIEIQIPKGREQFQAHLLWTRNYVKAESIPPGRLFIEPVSAGLLYAERAAVWLRTAGRLNIVLGLMAIFLFVIARKSNWKIRWSPLHLVFIALLALILFVRFNGIDCQLTEGLHPDERAVQQNAGVYRMGHLHPKSFLYSPGFHYMTALTDVYLSWVFGSRIPPHLAARLLAAAFSGLTCLLVFSIGKTLFSAKHGLIAMFFLGFSFMPVVIAHSGIIESSMVFFFVLAARSMLDWTQQSPLKTFFLSGLAAGAAVGVKQTSVFIVVPFLSMWLWTFRRRILSTFSFLRAVVWGGGVLAAYFALSPFSLIDFPNFYRDNLFQVRHLSGGIITAEFFRGVTYGPGLILEYLVDGMGWPVLIAAAAGSFFLIKQSARGAVLVLPFSIVYFGICSLVRTPPYHYPLLLCPFIAILAACFIDRLPVLRHRTVLTIIAIIALMYPSLSKTIQLQRVLQETDNRQEAVIWCYQNLPKGARIDYEFFGPRFLMPLFQTGMVKLFYRGPFEDYFQSKRPEYYIWDSSTSGLFLRRGEEAYPVENEWYRLLEMNGDVIQEFTGDTMGLFNPRIRIFRMHENFKKAG